MIAPLVVAEPEPYIYICIRNKKIHSLYHHNKLTKIKSIHASSFGPKQQPTNISLNTLHRINTNCSNDVLKMHSTLQHIYVARHFGYKNKHFRRALTRMSITTEDPLWHAIIQHIYFAISSFDTGTHHILPPSQWYLLISSKFHHLSSVYFLNSTHPTTLPTYTCTAALYT